ncbi:DUF6268 family outer membrane beta-barrel protein [Corallococcus sp. AS-1-6]|uniref:DUF6268 family outer membrane beta-barrel protein n=1 Tax=Corallococcus sp. AS-1-6 TaxID=2874599 RepID=UPI001CC13453|nr:DUF6268 family outer membrane beta-barrel protein [Corallococcus sp. AS-1-6]MBZ4371259.1 DUF6268 family outer membrane beta-barrel protein [Corallococcus sp. AS-1-6]
MRVDLRRAVRWRLLAPVLGCWAVAVLLLGAPAGAQTQADRLYVSYGLSGGGSLEAGGVHVKERMALELRVPLPLLVVGRTYLLPSVGYETRWMGADVPALREDAVDRQYHRVQLGLTAVRPLAPRWLLVTGVTASTRTDFRSSFDLALDTSWVAFAMARYQFEDTPGLGLMFGVVALWPFDKLPVIPMLLLTYRQGPYVVEVGLPRLTLLRKLGDTVELGLVGALDMQVLRTRFAPELQALNATYLRETQVRVGPTVNVHLGRDLWLSSSVGVSLINDYALLDRERDSLNVRGLDMGPAPYGRVVLGWRPAPPQAKARGARPAP